MVEFEKRFSISHGEYTDIEVYITYNKGDGYRTRRGYYVHVTPITVKGMFKTTCPSDGYKYFVQEVSRKSAKALNDVVANLESYTQPMADAICEKIGIEPIKIVI